MEMGESWQEACARELLEETGVLIDPGEVRLFGVHSSPAQGFLLVFGLAGARREEDLPSFAANDETDEMVIIHAAQELAFPLHTRVVGEYFRDRAGM